MLRPEVLLVTCEHGGNRVPSRYADLFRGARGDLDGHRGYDPGSLELARRVARSEKAPLVASTVSRLIVDLNRSLHHPRVFSEYTRELPREERNRIVARYYRPHRDRVESFLAHATTAGRVVLHLAVHTFVPRLKGVTRRADIALLYDPRRRTERALCAAWVKALSGRAGLRVRRNYPYRGADDGLTTFLRTRFPASRYLGVELEINQRHLTDEAPVREELTELILDTLRSLRAGGERPSRGAGLATLRPKRRSART